MGTLWGEPTNTRFDVLLAKPLTPIIRLKSLSLFCVFPSISVEFGKLDLASLQSIRQFAESFKKRKLPLNILVNNGRLKKCWLDMWIILYFGVFKTFYITAFTAFNVFNEILCDGSCYALTWSMVVVASY